ncbi:DUF6292 family protein [Kitasatospora sp. NPDC056184]|uniref:DUF6292 family protein n=1 Tax=Kitasatospora sp. NPDC056184 TaxID=3345738 RepID=UPI0035E12402
MGDYEVLTAAARPYLSTVLARALGEGLPVTGTEMLDGGPAADLEAETEGWIELDQEAVAHRYGAKVFDLTVYWDALSGWHIQAERPGSPDGDLYRWMGAGLVPAPERVTTFIATMLVDYTMTGSEERPFYRRVRQEVPSLTQRLRPYGS